MSLLEASCDRCAYRQLLSADVLRSYLWDSDHLNSVVIRTTYAWCPACREVVFAESIEDSAALAAEIEQAEHDGPEIYSTYVVPPKTWRDEKERHLAALHRRIAWLKTRVSPPRCLDCGSTAIMPFPPIPDDEELATEDCRPIPHPACGGLLHVRGVGFSRTRTWIFYSPEGDKLGTYEVLPHRGLVKRRDSGAQDGGRRPT